MTIGRSLACLSSLGAAVFLLLNGASTIKPARADPGNAQTWRGSLAGTPAWITVVPRGHRIAQETVLRNPWWAWGNTTTDAYLFAFSHPGNVRLILSFDPGPDGLPEARLYLNHGGHDPIDYSLSDGRLAVRSEGGHASLTMQPRNGPWLVHRRTNYNLRVSVAGRPGLEIRVGSGCRGCSESQPGIPRWETRSLVRDPHPGWGYTRFEATVRMHDAPPFRVAPPLMPGFPYIGIGRSQVDWFAQNPSPLHYDLNTSTFTTYSFVGFQNAGTYRLNSLTLPPHLDFESPFAVYSFDPSTRHGQLLLRAESYPSGDAFGPAPVADIRSTFRLSWAMAHPDLWEYSLDVAGSLPYGNALLIGGTTVRGLAPRSAPARVIARRWPLVTFVQAMRGYASSEGIYAFSAQTAESWGWLSGAKDTPPAYLSRPSLAQSSAFSTTTDAGSLPIGFRGEYSAAYFRRPTLYAGPIDRMLHLLYAKGGWINLGACRALHFQNLIGGPYIDAWTLRWISDQRGCGPRASPGAGRQSLYALDGMLLYDGPGGAEIRRATYPLSAWTSAPPTDRQSWQAFVRRATPYEAGRDPRNLSGWLAAFPGATLRLEGGHLTRVHATPTGFRAVLTVPRGARIIRAAENSGSRYILPTIPGPGAYVLQYDAAGGTWHRSPATLARLQVDIRTPGRLTAYYPASLQISLRNSGSEDWHGSITVSAGGDSLYRGTRWLTGYGIWRAHLPWSPASSGLVRLRVQAGSRTVERRLMIAQPARPSPITILALGAADGWEYWEAGLLLILLGAGSFLLWRGAYVGA